MDGFLRIRVKYNAPVVPLLMLLFAPLAILVGQFSSTGAAAVMITAIIIGWLLELGTPPVYEIIVMLVTSVIPVGLPMYNLVADGKTGKVELTVPGTKQ